MPITNIAGYKFVDLPEFATWRAPLRARCVDWQLKGTILLAPEGINLFIAGSASGIDAFLDHVRRDQCFGGAFSDLEVKRSFSERQPFRRMLVRVKAEIITMRHPMLKPAGARAPAVDALTLKRWLDRGHDDGGRPLLLLDTRNRFEVELGTFRGAVSLGLARFGEFPQALKTLEERADAPLQGRTVVTFCTGGIRCEKAALFMRAQGIDPVVQLDGGILRYFEEAGGDHWEGECFVFDDRVALDATLRETATRQCYACRTVLTPEQQTGPDYVPGVSCRYCAATA